MREYNRRLVPPIGIAAAVILIAKAATSSRRDTPAVPCQQLYACDRDQPQPVKG